MIRRLDGQGPPAKRCEVGGKAISIDRLARAGLSVPPGFCLSTAAHSAAGTAERLPPKVCDALAAALEALIEQCGPTTLLAVRSSALGEDSELHSFAGQHDTVLGVGVGEVEEAVLKCWASLHSRRSDSYRARAGAGAGAETMAVVVQALVPAEVSAVVFTANPVDRGDTGLVVNASFGLGAPIVSGEVDADTLVLDRESLAVRSLEIGEKRQRLTVASGSRIVRSSEEPDPRPALSPFRVTALARLSLAAERHLGSAADIEAACVGRRWWLLQARPITSQSEAEPRPQGAEREPAEAVR